MNQTLTKQEKVRLIPQRERVLAYMLDGQWHTLYEVAQSLDYPDASVSARFRDLRKDQYGGYTVDKRLKEGCEGTWEYRVYLEELTDLTQGELF